MNAKSRKNWEASIRICVPSPTRVSVYGRPCSHFFFFPTSACKLLYNRWQSQQLPRKHTCSSEIELPRSSFFFPSPDAEQNVFRRKNFLAKKTQFSVCFEIPRKIGDPIQTVNTSIWGRERGPLLCIWKRRRGKPSVSWWIPFSCFIYMRDGVCKAQIGLGMW